MQTSSSRSELLKHVFMHLQKHKTIKHSDLVGMAGSEENALSLIGFLKDSGYFIEHKDKLTFSSKIELYPLQADFDVICEWVLGDDESKRFRELKQTLIELHKQRMVPTTGYIPSRIEISKPKHEPDPEKLKKYVKEFLDVSEIAERQKQEDESDEAH